MVGPRRFLVLRLAAVLAGCVGHSAAGPEGWYAGRGTWAPRGDRVAICHAFGCSRVTPVSFTKAEIARMAAPLARPAATPEAERRAISQAVQAFEAIVGRRVGTSSDEGGFERIGGGDPTQMDCVDEATNTTSLLLLLSARGLLRHHRVAHPASRGILLDGRYPHASAVIAETKGGAAWVVDSWPRANAEPPLVEPLPRWLAARAGPAVP